MRYELMSNGDVRRLYELTPDGVRRLIDESGCDLRVTCFPYETAMVKYRSFTDRESHVYKWDHELHKELARLSGTRPDNKTVYAIRGSYETVYVEFHDFHMYISDEMYVMDHDLLANMIGYQLASKLEWLQTDTGLSRDQMLGALTIASKYLK